MIKKILGSYLINVFALYVASVLVGGFVLSDGFRSLLIVSLGFTLLHMVVRPILDLIFKPLNFLTLGLVGLVIDAVLLFSLTHYFPQVSVVPWNFAGMNINGFSLPARNLGIYEVTAIASLVITFVRNFLLSVYF